MQARDDELEHVGEVGLRIDTIQFEVSEAMAAQFSAP